MPRENLSAVFYCRCIVYDGRGAVTWPPLGAEGFRVNSRDRREVRDEKYDGVRLPDRGGKLAEALCGGTPYEESMREDADMLTQMAFEGIKQQFLKNFTIMRKGVPYTPGKSPRTTTTSASGS